MTKPQVQTIAFLCLSLASLLAALAWWQLRARARAGENGDAAASGWRRLVRPLAERMLPTTQAELEVLIEALAAAGRRDREAILRFTEERVGAMLGGALLALAGIAVIGGPFGFVVSLAAVVVGFLGPSRRLRMRAAERQDQIRRALPGTVDLLTTCIDAGLSLQQALARVAREIGANHPVFAEELVVASNEIDAGVSMADALRRMSRRVQVDDLAALCGVIAQAHGLGAPIGRTLNDYAESSRRQRMSMLEEQTGKLAASLVLPLALFLLPAAILTIIGPSVIQLIQVFSQ